MANADGKPRTDHTPVVPPPVPPPVKAAAADNEEQFDYYPDGNLNTKRRFWDYKR